MNIEELKDIRKGENVFILANGPSIKEEDLSLLKNKVSIGMNANPLLEEEFNFKSDFYLISDRRFLLNEDKKKIYDKSTSQFRILRKELHDLDTFDNSYYVNALSKHGFSENLKKGYYFASTTTMLAVQLAYYIGAKNIFILGMDLTYNDNSQRFYKEKNIQQPDDFTGTQIFNIRNSYLFLRDKKIGLYNCSKDSLLKPYIPFIDFKEAIKI